MKYLPTLALLFFAFALSGQTPDKVSIYQPDDVKLNTKRKPPLTVGECIGFLQANAPQVFQFRSMMGADTIRTTVEIRDTVHRLVEVFALVSVDTIDPPYSISSTTPTDPVDAWAFLSPTKPVTYSTPKIRYVRDTIYKTVYRDFLMHRDTIYQPCQDSPKPATFDGKTGLIASFIMGIIALIVAIYAYKKGKKDGHSLNRNV